MFNLNLTLDNGKNFTLRVDRIATAKGCSNYIQKGGRLGVTYIMYVVTKVRKRGRCVDRICLSSYGKGLKHHTVALVTAIN
jgi:hypothetical protein